jgi:simple sugar transport system ATP-binding protein
VADTNDERSSLGSGAPSGAPEPGRLPRGAPLLRLTKITKTFPGVIANRDVSIDLHAGEILGLLGENGAGKSTLMNIVTGLLRPDAGTIELSGEPVQMRNTQDARRLGIGMVHQHFMLVPTMTVAENVALGMSARRPPLSDVPRIADELREVSARYGLLVDPDAVVESLSVGERQRAEILRLLHHRAKVLIFDEPTSVLTPQEWIELSRIFTELAAEGRGIIFITHKLDELLGVADRCTVMRDGEVVGTIPVASVDRQTLATMMVGRDVVLRVERPLVPAGDVVLDVRGVTLERDGRAFLDDVSFAVHQGEVLGIVGVDGNGQSELVQVLTGLVNVSEGTIVFHDNERRELTPREFIDLGGAVIPEDRHARGVAMELDLRDNLMMADFATPAYSTRGLLKVTAITSRCNRLIDEYDIRAPGSHVRVDQLSGGNQQKAVLAREMDRKPSVLIAAQPTRGLDVGAVEFVYQQINEHKRNGGATLLISTELDEAFTLADRIGVMFDGRLLRILDADEATVDKVGLLMAGEEAAA